MNQEIWLAQMETKTVAFVGRQKDVESGIIDMAAALLIAESDGKALLVIDGHQAQHLIFDGHFKDKS